MRHLAEVLLERVEGRRLRMNRASLRVRVLHAAPPAWDTSPYLLLHELVRLVAVIAAIGVRLENLVADGVRPGLTRRARRHASGSAAMSGFRALKGTELPWG